MAVGRGVKRARPIQAAGAVVILRVPAAAAWELPLADRAAAAVQAAAVLRAPLQPRPAVQVAVAASVAQ